MRYLSVALRSKSSVKYTKHDLYSTPWATLDKFMPFMVLKIDHPLS